jgi:hypothetical protein
MAERLPLELLQHVFTLGDRPEIPQPGGGGIYSPLIVSKRWRNAALSIPRLWTSIELTRWHADRMPEQFMRYWLLRSGNKPLDLELNFDANWEPEPLEAPEHLYELLIEHISRWKTLTFQGPSEDIEDTFWPNLHEAILLEELVLISSNEMDVDHDSGEREHDRPGLPVLTVLFISGWPLQEMERIGGPSVTTLSLGELTMTPDGFRRLSEDMPNVTHLTLQHFEVWMWGDAIDPEEVAEDYEDVFENLETLHCQPMALEELQAGGPTALLILFRSAKNLKSLKMQLNGDFGIGSAPRDYRFSDLPSQWLHRLPSTLTEIEIIYHMRGNQEAELLESQTREQLMYLTKLRSLTIRKY